MNTTKPEKKVSNGNLIGDFFGGRDHTTVMHAVEKVGKLVIEKEQFKQEINLILDKLFI